MKRNIFDVMAEFEVTLKGQPGPIPVGGHQLHKRRWRIAGLRNAETGEYHIYVTNVPPEMPTCAETTFLSPAENELRELGSAGPVPTAFAVQGG